jgi:hypothetical protein
MSADEEVGGVKRTREVQPKAKVQVEVQDAFVAWNLKWAKEINRLQAINFGSCRTGNELKAVLPALTLHRLFPLDHHQLRQKHCNIAP